MATNEKLNMVLLHEREKAMLQGIDQVQTIGEGDLQTLEQSLLTACLAVGRTVMEQVLNHAREQAERQALNLMQPRGEAVREQQEEQVQALFEQAANKETHAWEHGWVLGPSIRRLSIETDGVTARIRRGSVTMQEAEAKRQGDVSREIKGGAVFEGIPGRERWELVPGVFLDEPGAITDVARRLNVEEFGRFLYALAQRCGLDRALEVVILGDGVRWIRPVVEDHFPNAVQIVELYHAREHLWKVANAVHGSATPQGAAWAKQADELLSHGKIEALVQMIEKLPSIPAFPGASRSIPEMEADYFLSNAQRMRYPTFRAKGMHIGSGIAQAACKTVVSSRAKKSGMPWTPDGLDAVLALRTSVLNQSDDSFWHQSPPLLAA